MAIIYHNKRTIRTKDGFDSDGKQKFKQGQSCRKCGAPFFYWGHDTEKPGRKWCNQEGCACKGQKVNWTPLDGDKQPHVCGNTGTIPDLDPDDADSDDDDLPVAAVITDVPPARPAISGHANGHVNGTATALAGNAQAEAMALLAKASALLTPAANVNESEVRQIIAETVPEMVAEAVMVATAGLRPVVRIEVNDRATGAVRTLDGVTNAALPDIIEGAAAGLNILMVGPMGTGKSYMAKQVGKALGLPVREISLTPQTAESRLFGYMDAQGRYVRTAFRDWWEHGGIFHFDELDNGHAAIMAGINAAMAMCRDDDAELEFPDGRVKKADRTIGLASANTYGRGPDRQYLRQPLDAATMDRFEPVPVLYDHAVEEAACLATGLDKARVDRTLSYVRHLRDRAETAKLPLMLGLRRSHALCTWQSIGRTPKRAVEISLRRDISDSDWRKVTEGAPTFA
jgi:cobaltochelatase CobS